MAFPTSLTNAVDFETDILADHINILEAKVGIDDSAVTTSLDYLVKVSEDPGHTHTPASAPGSGGSPAWAAVTSKPDAYQGDYAGATGLDKLNAALAALGTTNPVRLHLNAALTLTADLDLTAYSNIELHVHPNCPISYDSSTYTFTFGGTIADCLHKIFNDTAASPDYSKGVKLVGQTNWVRPNWWGMKVGTGPTDTTAAAINVKGIRAAVQAVPNSVIVLFTSGYFPINAKITFPQRVTLKGVASARTVWTTDFDTCISSTTAINDDMFLGVDGTASGLSVHDIFFEAYGNCGHIFNIGSEGGSGIHYFEFDGCQFFGDPNSYSNDTSHYHIWAKNAHQGVIGRCRFAGYGSKIYDGMDGWIGGGTEITGSGAFSTTYGIYLNGAELHDVIVYAMGTGIYVNGESIMDNVRVDQCAINIDGSYGYSINGERVRLTEGYLYSLKTCASLINLTDSRIGAFGQRTFTPLNITVGTTNGGTHQNTLTLGTSTWDNYSLGAGCLITLSGASEGGNNCNLYIISTAGAVATVYDLGGTMVAESIVGATVVAERRGIYLDGISEGRITSTSFVETANTGATGFRAIDYAFSGGASDGGLGGHNQKCIVMEGNPGLDLPQETIYYKDFQPTQVYYKDSFSGTLARKKSDGTTDGDKYQDITLIRTSGFTALGVAVGDYVHVQITTAGYDGYWFHGRLKAVSDTKLTFEPIPLYYPVSDPDFSFSLAFTVEKMIVPWAKQHITTNGTYDIDYLPITSEGRKRNLMVESGLTLKQWSAVADAATTVDGTVTAITGAFDAFTTSPNAKIGDGFLIASYSQLCAAKFVLTSGAAGVTYKWQYFGYNAAWKDFPTGAVSNANGLNSTGTQIIYFKVPADAHRKAPSAEGGIVRHPLYMIRCYATADGGGGGVCSAAPLVCSIRLNTDFPIVSLSAGDMAVVSLEDRYGVPVMVSRSDADGGVW